MRTAGLFRPSLCAEVLKIKMTGLPECFTKKQQLYHGNKLQLLKIFDPTPSLTSTLKIDALISDFPAAVTTAKTFNEFADGIIEFVENQSSWCSRIDFVIVILTILWSHIHVTPVVVDNFFHLQKQPIYQTTCKAIFWMHNRNKVGLFLAGKLSLYWTHTRGG